MHRLLTAAFIFISINLCSAQQQKIDSLVTELQKHTAADTTRIEILNSLSYYTYQVNPDNGIKYADEAIALSKKLNDNKRLAAALQFKGMNYGEKGDYAAALEVLKQSAALTEKTGENKRLMAVQNSTAIIYMRLADFPKALGMYYKNLGSYEAKKMESEAAMTNGNIAIVYSRMGDEEKSLQFNQKAIDIRKKLNEEKALADLYNSRANSFDNIKKFDDAINYYRQSVELAKKINYSKGITTASGNLGYAFFEKGNADSAFYYINLALDAYRKSGNKSDEAITLGNLGQVIANADDQFLVKHQIRPADKYRVALSYHTDSEKLMEEMEDPYGQSEQLKYISDIYKKEKQYQKAFETLEQHANLKDSILNDEKKEAVHQSETQYAVQVKEDSLTLVQQRKDLEAKAEITKQKTIKQFLIAAGVIFITAAIISFIFYKKRRDAKQKQQEAEFQTEVADTEMKALRAQMNPHFIFNSLNSIGDYLNKNNVQEADRYLGKFAKLMRLILENSEQKEVPLADDLKALELYMQLEALRLNNKFTYEIKIDDAIDPETTLVPPLILQPFVENSIWHGIAKKEGVGKIKIQINKEGDSMINCIVEDDGVGRKQSAAVKTSSPIPEKSSLGMKITQTRIDILNKIKNSNAAVQLSDMEQGLRVEVKLPLASSF